VSGARRRMLASIAASSERGCDSISFIKRLAARSPRGPFSHIEAARDSACVRGCSCSALMSPKPRSNSSCALSRDEVKISSRARFEGHLRRSKRTPPASEAVAEAMPVVHIQQYLRLERCRERTQGDIALHSDARLLYLLQG
jgi:hypothetical protein